MSVRCSGRRALGIDQRRQFHRVFDIGVGQESQFGHSAQLQSSTNTAAQEAGRFLEAGIVKFLQPDLGRVGLTESLALARAAAAVGATVVPHVSTACGPQIAAALHLAAAAESCNLVEYNPRVLEWANRFVEKPIEIEAAGYVVPNAPGLGLGAVSPATRSTA